MILHKRTEERQSHLVGKLSKLCLLCENTFKAKLSMCYKFTCSGRKQNRHQFLRNPQTLLEPILDNSHYNNNNQFYLSYHFNDFFFTWRFFIVFFFLFPYFLGLREYSLPLQQQSPVLRILMYTEQPSNHNECR